MMTLQRLLVLCLLCSTGLAQSAVELDRSALEAYRAQDYESAAERWSAALEAEELADRSQERARILHNLGNTALRGGDALAAVADYRASLNLRPRDPDTLANFDFARSEAQLAPAARDSLLSSLTLHETEWLVLSLAFVLFLALVGEAFFGGGFKHLAVLVALLLLASLIPWARQVAAQDDDAVMVVQRSGTSLRSEPRIGATALVKLDPGTEHRVKDTLPNWIAVETNEGIEGWVREADLLSTSR